MKRATLNQCMEAYYNFARVLSDSGTFSISYAPTGLQLNRVSIWLIHEFIEAPMAESRLPIQLSKYIYNDEDVVKYLHDQRRISYIKIYEYLQQEILRRL